MGKSSPKAPKAPDPAATAAAQAGINKEAVLESARVNQINEVGPQGSLTYSGTIGSPDRTRTTSLTETGQSQLDQRNQLAELLGGYALERGGQIDQSKFNLEGLPEVRSDFGEDAQRVEQATYERALGLMNPQYEREQRRTDQQLANRGIPIGGEAYGDVKQQEQQQRNEALQAASLGAVQAGRSEQSRLYGLESADRSRALNERLLERAQPVNELAALLQGSPATGQPNFGQQAQYQIAPGDFQGAAQNQYQGQLNQYNSDRQNRQAGLGGLFSLGGTIASAGTGSLAAGFFCSPMFKENGRSVSDILPRIDILKVEAWDYKPSFGDGKTHIGPYADQFQQLFGVGDGVMINPIDAFGVCLLGIKDLLQRVIALESK